MSASLQGDFNIHGLSLRSFVNLSPLEAEEVRKWRNHPEIRRFMYNDREIDSIEHIQFIENLRESSHSGYWVVYEENRPLGTLSLTRFNPLHHHAFLGIYANPFDSTKGRGKRLMEALLALSFSHFGLHTLKLEVMEENERAIALYEAMGFTREGRWRDYIFKEGRYRSILLMGILNETL